MISVQDAISALTQHRAAGADVLTPLSKALGGRLARDVLAKVTLPPRDASAMDGYAVRFSDVGKAGAQLTVIGEAPAGSPFGGAVGQGEAVRIFTGGAVPEALTISSFRKIPRARETSSPRQRLMKRGAISAKLA